MSEEKDQQPAGEANKEEFVIPADTGAETYEVVLNKSKNELTIKDPNTNRLVTLKARVEEPDEDEEREVGEGDDEPLTPDEFRAAMERMESLGLTWTADRFPRVKAKDEASEGVLFSDEYEDLQEQYPTLPRELSVVVPYALTRNKVFISGGLAVVGGEDYLEQKVAVVSEFLITPKYRSEFFFKQAIKVPYFETIDWEVIFKTHERNVSTMPGVAYALLMLTLHNTNPRVSRLDEHQNITVAADLVLVDKLIRLLLEVRVALEEAGKLSEVVNERLLKGKGDAKGE